LVIDVVLIININLRVKQLTIIPKKIKIKYFNETKYLIRQFLYPMYKLPRKIGMKFKMEKKGQIWVETVIYVLIALIMIGAVLAFINPKVKEIQDKLTLDKTVVLLEELDT